MNKFVPMEFSELKASQSWTVPSWGTSDLFCKCDRKTKLLREKAYSQVDVPQNQMGYQYPHSGTCYAGIFTLSHGSYREYLQTKLKEPLQKNMTYLFTLYLSLADYSSLSIDQLGVCFLTNKVEYKSSDEITGLNPIYMNIAEEVGNDIENWHPISVSYTSHGGELYVLFGGFEINKIEETKLKPPKEIKSLINQTIARDAYYFIDDVSLVEIFPNEETAMLVDPESDLLDDISPDSLFILKNVLFRTNETDLLPSSYSELNLLVEYLNKNLGTRVGIFGHTDNSGNEIANKKLSTGRAKAVADYLTSRGIAKTRVDYNGYGSLRPIATNETEEGKQQNRRVEFQIIDD